MKARVKIKTAKLVEDQFGYHIEITKVGLYDENGKYIKWLKLNEQVVKILTKMVIDVDMTENQ